MCWCFQLIPSKCSLSVFVQIFFALQRDAFLKLCKINSRIVLCFRTETREADGTSARRRHSDGVSCCTAEISKTNVPQWSVTKSDGSNTVVYSYILLGLVPQDKGGNPSNREWQSHRRSVSTVSSLFALHQYYMSLVKYTYKSNQYALSSCRAI